MTAARISEALAAAGADGWVHAVTRDGTRDVGHRSDELVVTASVFKIPVLLELAVQMDDGRIDPLQRMAVTPEMRVVGPTGLSTALDTVELSVRDLARSMMTVSDNTATDIVLDLVGGPEVVNDRLHALGLLDTVLVGDCDDLIGELLAHAALQEDETLADAGDERLAGCATLDPEKTNRTTAREICELLRLVWTDAAAPAAACDTVRRTMAQQVWPHRLRSGFPGAVNVAGKTGTLPYWRNEAGVVTYPDGESYAVSVFTRAHSRDDVQPAVDTVIGTAARLAVESLRES